MSFADVAFLLAILSFGICNVHALSKPKHNKVVTCYVASWAVYRVGDGAFTLENLRPELCTHLIYAFAGLNTSSWTIKSLDPWNDIEKDGKGNYKKMTDLRKKGLKVLLGIGGWNEGSGNYSIMASSPDRRRTFIDSTVKFLNTYGFNGLDFDWEFPGQRGGTPGDKQSFVSLVKELRDAFKSNLLLTAAVSAVKNTIDVAYDIPELSKYLDYIHVMAYDYHGLWDRKVLPNSPLRSNDGLSVEDTITYLLQKGVPTKKLVLGLAMYGRTFILTKVPESNVDPIGLTSLETSFKGPYTSEEGFMGFNEICETLSRSQDWTNGWDNYSSTAYAIKTDHVVVYDNVKAIVAKMEYVKKKDLAGVMIWSIDMDDFRGNCETLHGVNYPLMRAINETLHETNNTGTPNKSIKVSSNIEFVLLIATSLFFLIIK
ncbi:probable chitinase 2 [Pseudomyrmex gracilis]|uniref:probable chitinase 2 n=1 Tax=Pseudomyrmex gracilis TaxID=219809 RepID=UPI000994D773|nr:probable chitinase 2 [Pseudomyrmex gracilis]